MLLAKWAGLVGSSSSRWLALVPRLPICRLTVEIPTSLPSVPWLVAMVTPHPGFLLIFRWSMSLADISLRNKSRVLKVAGRDGFFL